MELISQEIETDSATIKLISPQIVENRIKDNIDVDVKDVLEIKESNLKLTQGRTYGLLVDSGLYTSITNEARNLSASKDFQQFTTAKALLVRSLSQRIIGAFYVKFNKPSIKTKVFSEREEAIEWLSEQIKKMS